MGKNNCWEIPKCGRELNGVNSVKCGVCPAALPNNFDGVNGGKDSGRFCWVIAGTCCDGNVAGTYAQKLANCVNCKFLKQVNEEEGRDFILMPKKLKREK
ncbi:hypothetical protein QUH73_10245 [Labilibaculum sp. K2S]|uniref:two-CW domain-containing protein n=1 Tax=Labilibaculum sp. K2S TaxID=3056386 RepID=UPI0025A3FECA|nr:hypothetical protein [Labilibaculum sp. K2S]MDM8160193.1 hypothetical protein [Labilibaculum sp. K2S]